MSAGSGNDDNTPHQSSVAVRIVSPKKARVTVPQKILVEGTDDEMQDLFKTIAQRRRVALIAFGYALLMGFVGVIVILTALFETVVFSTALLGFGGVSELLCFLMLALYREANNRVDSTAHEINRRRRLDKAIRLAQAIEDKHKRDSVLAKLSWDCINEATELIPLEQKK